MLVYTARRLDESGSRTDGAVHGLAERHLRRARTGFEEPNPRGDLSTRRPIYPKGVRGQPSTPRVRSLPLRRTLAREASTRSMTGVKSAAR